MDAGTITYEVFEDTLIIHMPKELDHHNCRRLKTDTDLMLEENCVRRMIFDFEKTQFMDSSGIGVLLNRYKEMTASRGSVCYCGASRRVHRLMEMSGICSLMEGYENREQAVGASKSMWSMK